MEMVGHDHRFNDVDGFVSMETLVCAAFFPPNATHYT